MDSMLQMLYNVPCVYLVAINLKTTITNKKNMKRLDIYMSYKEGLINSTNEKLMLKAINILINKTNELVDEVNRLNTELNKQAETKQLNKHTVMRSCQHEYCTNYTNTDGSFSHKECDDCGERIEI